MLQGNGVAVERKGPIGNGSFVVPVGAATLID